MNNSWQSEKLTPLLQAILTLKTDKEVAAFMRDLLTEAEIEEFVGRFAVAQALATGKTQRVVAKETGISIATVTRVNQWLQRGMNGYKTAIERLSSQHHHHKI